MILDDHTYKAAGYVIVSNLMSVCVQSLSVSLLLVASSKIAKSGGFAVCKKAYGYRITFILDFVLIEVGRMATFAYRS